VQVPIMPFRLEELEAVLAGYAGTGVPLVAAEGGALRAGGFSDDPGLYVVVPLLARAFGLDAAGGVAAFVVGMAALAFVVGGAGLLWLARGVAGRVAAVGFAALVALLCLYVGDVYAVAPAVTLAFVPWVLVAWRDGRAAPLLAMLALVGAFAGMANAVRSHAGTGLVVFALVLLAVGGGAARRRVRGVAALVAGAALAALGLHGLERTRDAFLSERVAAYAPPPSRHPFWHSVYIGLGYTDNPHVPAYRDEVAMARVAELDPAAGFLSPRYEATLRAEVFRIARANPLFAVENLAAKAGVVLFHFLLFLNVGAIALLRRRVRPPVLAALLAGAAFNALFGLLVVPILPYLSGLAAFAALLGALSFGTAIDAPTHRAGRPAGAA